MEQTAALGSKFYVTLIKTVEKKYTGDQSDEAIWMAFKAGMTKWFKLEISFDSRFSQALRNYFHEVAEEYRGEEALLAKMQWIQKLNQLAYDNQFLSYRDYFNTKEQITLINESPSNEWLNQLCFIRACADLKEFRSEFLIRFAKFDEEEVERISEELDSDEHLQRMKEEYIKFFQNFFAGNIDHKVAMFVESEWSRWENKTKMLPQDLICRLDKMFGKEVGRSQSELQFNDLLVEIAQTNLYQNDREVQQRLENEVQLIQKALQKFSGLNYIKDKGLVLHLGTFGSLVSGFAGLDADLDLTILTNNYVNETEFLKILHQFLKKEYQEGDRRSNGRRVLPELIATAKTPLIAISINERGKSVMKIDLIINNVLGVINSKFLKVYGGVRWVKNLGLLVKLWGKSVDLIGKSYLSSYAIILMLIHFLIKKELVRPIMDARTRTNDSPHFKLKRMKMSEIEQFNVYYEFKTRTEDVTALERVNYFGILEDFMKYYAYDYWKEKEQQRIITVDQSTLREVDKEMAITIKDPFDMPHNPGRLKLDSEAFLKQKFKEAHETLFLARRQGEKQGQKAHDKQDKLFKDMGRIRQMFG